MGFIGRTLARLLILAGLALLVLLTLCFTPVPWRIYRWLGTDSAALYAEPDYIVVLGGGGIPSESGLMRTYRAAEEGRRWPTARLIVALPGQVGADTSQADRMRAELILRSP